MGFNSGPPFVPSMYNNNVQIFQSKNHVVIMTEMIHDARIVKLDNRPPLDPALHAVVRRVARPLGRRHTRRRDAQLHRQDQRVSRCWQRQDDAAHRALHARRTRIASTINFTINDPSTFTKPFTALVPMVRADGEIFEYACHEGNYGMSNMLSGARQEEREAAQKKDAERASLNRSHSTEHTKALAHANPASQNSFVSLLGGIVLACGSFPSYAQEKAARTADGKPDLNGIWQAMGSAHWNLEPHNAQAGPIVEMGALGAIPGGLGVVAEGRIPYKPEAAKKRDENKANWLEHDPIVKCYLPGVPRATYLPHPFQIVQEPNTMLLTYEFAGADRIVYFNQAEYGSAGRFVDGL